MFIFPFLAQVASEGFGEKATRILEQGRNVGKLSGIVIATFMIVIAAAVKRTLGAILVALVVAGVVVYGVAHVVDLGGTAKDTINGGSLGMGTAPAVYGAIYGAKA